MFRSAPSHTCVDELRAFFFCTVSSDALNFMFLWFLSNPLFTRLRELHRYLPVLALQGASKGASLQVYQGV